MCMLKKSNRLTLLTLFILLVILAGCGAKSKEKIVKKIESVLANVEGYKVEADMTMKTGSEDRNYDIDIWYKKDEEEYYRVTLESDEEDGGQVILKNNEGVYVLTPALNKSFEFQTDWPNNSSQPYLYQSLIQDVVKDKNATFVAGDAHYMFKTETNYQNNTNLPYQEVYFDKKSYLPLAVKILDKDQNPLVEVTFKNFDMKPTFAKGDFDQTSILESGIAQRTEESMAQSEHLVV